VIYTERPKKADASQRTWDYATIKYGIVEKMIFYAPCCSKTIPFWTVLVNKDVIKIKSEDVRAFQKMGKK
jgi:hypothetical protein